MIPTRIYKPIAPEENYQLAQPVDPANWETITRLGERPRNIPWRAIDAHLIKEDDYGRPSMRADMPWMGSDVLILRDDAIESIGALLRPHGELLALTCDDARLMLFTAPPVVGVLNETRSEIVRFPNSDRIMDLRTPVFNTHVLGNTQAFKLAEDPRGALYLQEELVNAICATGMSSGTDFTVVYDDAPK